MLVIAGDVVEMVAGVAAGEKTPNYSTITNCCCSVLYTKTLKKR